MTKQQYVEYLVSTPINYTCTNLAEHVEGLSHDVVTDYQARERHTARQVWELVQSLITDSPTACLIFDDSAQDKRYARKIELVKRQYSGTEHGIVAGIGVVNLVHTTRAADEFYPIDYRIYAPATDGKRKTTTFGHVAQLQARTVLFDSWYASADNLKLVHRASRIFYTTLKANRLVSVSKADGYVHLDTLEWTPEHLRAGRQVRVQRVP